MKVEEKKLSDLEQFFDRSHMKLGDSDEWEKNVIGYKKDDVNEWAKAKIKKNEKRIEEIKKSDWTVECGIQQKEDFISIKIMELKAIIKFIKEEML